MDARRLMLVVSLAFAVPAVCGAATLPYPTVQPSGDSVPANLLRASLSFADAPAGPVLPRITLSHENGAPIDQPFLPQELWSPDGRVLTLLFHPGRVKTGLIARETLGPILREGDDVVLALDGEPLHRWHVTSADTRGPDIAAWQLFTPFAGSRQPLRVALDAAVEGRDAGYIAVADPEGRRLAGDGRLGAGETTWTFTPDEAWRPGAYRLMVRATLEDPAGNRSGDPFEVSYSTGPRADGVDSSLPFHVEAPTRQP